MLRAVAPEPPFWAAITIAPYSFPRSKPLALDYVGLTGTGVDSAVVTVCDDPPERIAEFSLPGPILIDATERAEAVYGRGAAIHRAIREQTGTSIVHLISTSGAPPLGEPSPQSLVAVGTWPLHLSDLERLARDLRAAGWRWGLAVPILFPATTDLAIVQKLAGLARSEGGEFLTGIRFDLDPNARRALAASIPTDDDTYSVLFDQGEESVAVATERHIAALAFEHGLSDAALPPDREERSNWNAAIFTALAGTRLIAMREDMELGWEFVRSARQLAVLPKPLTTVAAAANLSIIEGLPPQITDALEEWLQTGRARLFEEINTRWRLRRDYRR